MDPDARLKEIRAYWNDPEVQAQQRRCTTEDCPGDGRYQPPGRGHLPGCQHDAVKHVWGDVPSWGDMP